MGVFYLLHEYTERYHPDFTLGKKFARTVILGFIFYYILYFIVPNYIDSNYANRMRHFIRYLIVIDLIASSIFYGGVLNGISFWTRGAPVVADLAREAFTGENDDSSEEIILGDQPI